MITDKMVDLKEETHARCTDLASLCRRIFFSLGNLITSAQRQRQTASYDSAADFFVRRLQENERTLAILTLRIEKSFPNEVELISDLTELHSMENELTRDFVRAVEECELDTPPSPPCNEPLVHVSVTRSGLFGRPRLQVLQEHLQTLHHDAGFRWTDFGRILGISDRTLRRRIRHEFGLPVGMGEHFSDITDDELDVNVREILQATPNVGQYLVESGLRQRGVRIQRHRIQEAIRRVDPVVNTLREAQQIIRGVYSVPCPNALW